MQLFKDLDINNVEIINYRCTAHKLAIYCLSPQINSCIEMKNSKKYLSYHDKENDAILPLVGPRDAIPNRYSFDPSEQISGPPESP